MSRKKQIVKFPFRFAGQYNSIACIYKLSFKDHFFIAGTKALHKRVYVHSEEIERKLRLGWKANDLYKNIIPFIQANEVTEFVVEVLFEVATESELPAAEQRMFDIVKDNPKCLNASFEAVERQHLQKDVTTTSAGDGTPKINNLVYEADVADGEVKKETKMLPLPADFLKADNIAAIDDAGEVLPIPVEKKWALNLAKRQGYERLLPAPVVVKMEATQIGNTTFYTAAMSAQEIQAPPMVPKVKSDSPLSFKERMALINQKYATHNA